MTDGTTTAALYRWHSPHPGMGGASARLPGEARAVAMKLDGTVTTAGEARDMLALQMGTGYEVDCGPSKFGDGDSAYLRLYHGDRKKFMGPVHCWRVLIGKPE